MRKTFELRAETGRQQPDFDVLFAALDADTVGAMDGAHDLANMPIEREPRPVQNDLDTVRARS